MATKPKKQPAKRRIIRKVYTKDPLIIEARRIIARSGILEHFALDCRHRTEVQNYLVRHMLLGRARANQESLRFTW